MHSPCQQNSPCQQASTAPRLPRRHLRAAPLHPDAGIEPQVFFLIGIGTRT
jgi:hypothetical protein